MSFPSVPFILFFCTVLVLYYVLPKKAQPMLLLLANAVFLYFAGWRALCYLGCTILCSYVCARGIERAQQHGAKELEALSADAPKDERERVKRAAQRRARRYLLLGLFFTLGMLCVVKYAGSVVQAARTLFAWQGGGAFLGILFPLGISFYTFQSVGYLVDVHRKKAKAEHNLLHFALFLSLFPQLTQGPIGRFDKLMPELAVPHPLLWDNLRVGALRMVLGFCKKLIVANRLLVAVRAMSGDVALHSGIFFWIHALFYLVALYLDFSGGIDIALGAARMLGITLAENFDRPFFSKNTAEFWRRWHMSLGSWFRDYVYYPVSLSGPMLGLSKKAQKLPLGRLSKMIHMHIATLLIWFLIGLWHGASANFIVWGLLNGFIIIISTCIEPLYGKIHGKGRLKKTHGYAGFEMLRTFLLMAVVMALDCYTSVRGYFRAMLSGFTFAGANTVSTVMQTLGLARPDWMVIAVGCALLLGYEILQRRERAVRKLRSPIISYLVLGVGILAILVFGAYGQGYDAGQFIYNQF